MKKNISVLYVGDLYEADDASDLVHQMREAHLTLANASDEKFMKEKAHSVMMVSGGVVPTDSVENFVKALIEIGELKEVDADKEKEKSQAATKKKGGAK